MRRESVTIDEPLNLTAGYAFMKFGDYRLADTNGVLPQRWFALPLLLMKVQFPDRTAETWHRPGYVGKEVCWAFLFDSGNRPDVMIFRGRLMALLIGIALIVAVYGWTSRFFGPMPGLLAAFFCALCPTILAHGHLMTLDGTAALLFLMSGGCFWLLLHRVTIGRLAASALCFGLLMVTKMSAPLFVPIALLMLAARAATGIPWPWRVPGFAAGEIRTGRAWLGGAALIFAVHAAVAVTVIWGFFGWRFLPAADWDPARDSYTEPLSTMMPLLGAMRPLIVGLDNLKLLPEAYIFGLGHTIEHVSARHAFLNGQYSTSGWWYYFPYCLLVKTTLPALAAGALGAAYLVWRRVKASGPRARAWIDRTSPFWSLLLAYGVAAIFTRLNIGQRHILPMYPALFALAGAGLWWLMGRAWSGFAVAAALVVLQVATVARAHPYYLSYFNTIAGGVEGGYRHLTDSNVDWGQDLPSLAAWLRSDPEVSRGGRLYVNCFAYDSPDRWGIKAYRMPYDVTNPNLSSADPVAFEPGTYCISATALMIPGPPWTPVRENQYRAMLVKFRELEQTIGPRPADDESRAIWADFLLKLANNQYYRLRSHLMNRKPDTMVGNSILIFRISNEELHRALVP
jgi:hypothetical protein